MDLLILSPFQVMHNRDRETEQEKNPFSKNDAEVSSDREWKRFIPLERQGFQRFVRYRIPHFLIVASIIITSVLVVHIYAFPYSAMGGNLPWYNRDRNDTAKFQWN
jgi:hypothetical protein